MPQERRLTPLPVRPRQQYEDRTPVDATLVGAAFRQENPIVAFNKWRERPEFEPQPGFDITKRAKEVPGLFENYRSDFLGTVSDEDFDHRVANLREELRDQQRITQSGIPGILMAMGAGVLSPTTLIPIVGLGVRANAAARAGIVATNAAGAVAIDEAVLREANVTRTDLDTVLSIGGAAVLGGALGALTPAVSRSARQAATKEIEDTILNPDRTLSQQDQLDVIDAYTNGGTVGAAEVGRISPAGSFEGLTRAGRLLSEQSPVLAPVVRAQTREYPLQSAADVVQQFSTGGLRATTKIDPNSSLGLREAVGEGGPLEGISRAQERVYQDRITDIISKSWTKHNEIRPGFLAEAKGEALSFVSGTRLGRPKPGKLTWEQYNNELHRALNMGDTSDFEEIQEAAQALRSEVVDIVTQEAQRVGILPSELTEGMLKGAMTYFMRIYDHDMLRQHPNAFVEILTQNSEANMQARFAKKVAKAKEEDIADLQAARDRELAGEVAEQQRETVTQEIEALSTGPRATAVNEVAELQRDAKKLAKQAKERGNAGDFREATRLEKEAQELRDKAKQLRENNPDIDAFKAEKAKLERRRRDLGRNLDKLIGKQAQAVESADKLTRLMDDQLVSATPRIQKILGQMDEMSDEAFDAAAEKLAKEFEKVEGLLERGEQSLAQLASRYPELVDAPDEFLRRVQRFKENVFEHLPLERQQKGEKYLRIDSAESKQEALDAINAVLDEGEYKVTRGEDIEFVELTTQQRKSLEEWRDSISKLHYSDAEKLAKAERRFDLTISRQIKRQDRFDNLLERLREADTLDREAVRQAALTRLEDLVRRVRDTMSKRAVREKALRDKASKIGSEDIPKFIEETERLKEAPRQRREALEEAARRAGSDDTDLDAGTFDFRRTLRAEAEKLLSKLQGNYVRTPLDGDFVNDTGGPALARTLDIPYDKKFTTAEGEYSIADFLVKDVATVAHTYTRTMVPDITLADRFGSPSVKKWLESEEGLLRKEYNRRVEQIANDLDRNDQPLSQPRSEAEKTRLTKEVGADLEYGQRAIRTLIERLRHTHGVPEDPSSGYIRSLRSWRLAQVPLYMGNVAFASLPELARPVFRYGLETTYRDSWSRLVSDTKGWFKQVNEMYKAGQGLDARTATRFMAWADIEESVLRHTPFEKIIEFLSMKTGSLALFNRMTQLLKMLAAPVSMGQFWRSLEKVMDPSATEATVRKFSKDKAMTLLANAGIGEQQARRLWAQVQEHGFERTKSGFIWPNFDNWTDQQALQQWRGWLGQELDTVIITPGLERPIWTTASEEARVVNTFRSFMWSSTSKTLLSGVQQRDAAVAQGLALTAGMSYLSYAAWAAQYGPGTQQWEEFLEAEPGKIMDEVIYRSGVLGSVGEAKDILTEIPWLRGALTFSPEGATRIRDANVAQAALGVSATTTERIARLLGGLGDPTQATTGVARQLTPYNNVFYMRRPLMEVEEGAAELLGIPETRR
jgi:predicted RNA binding protein with dsRBD fold (UPF0201 family)